MPKGTILYPGTSSGFQQVTPLSQRQSPITAVHSLSQFSLTWESGLKPSRPLDVAVRLCVRRPSRAGGTAQPSPPHPTRAQEQQASLLPSFTQPAPQGMSAWPWCWMPALCRMPGTQGSSGCPVAGSHQACILSREAQSVTAIKLTTLLSPRRHRSRPKRSLCSLPRVSGQATVPHSRAADAVVIQFQRTREDPRSKDAKLKAWTICMSLLHFAW